MIGLVAIAVLVVAYIAVHSLRRRMAATRTSGAPHALQGPDGQDGRALRSRRRT